MESSRRIKVAHVLKSSIYSGAENVVMTIIENLKTEFDFIYIATDGPIRKVLDEKQIPYILLDVFNSGNIRKAIKKWNPDIIHAHDFSATVACSWIRGDFRLISHLHYNPPWTSKWNVKTLVYTGCYPNIRKLLTVSDKSFQEMIFERFFQKKATAVGNPVNGKEIRKKAEEALPEQDKNGCDIIFVGRLVEEKNPQRFIELIGELRDKGWNDVKVWMLGEGEFRAECENMIKKLKLQDNIEMKGFQKNPYPYISHSRLMCLTSRWEGFGLVAAEANILGIPVLSTDTAGCREIFGEASLEICKSDKDFLNRMILLKNSEDEYKIWKDRSVARGKSLDNIDEYMKRLSDIYMNEV